MDVMIFNEIADKIMNRIISATGLNLSQIRLLLFFNDQNNEPLTIGELASGLKISISTLSRQLKQSLTNKLVLIDSSTKNSTKLIQLNDDGLAMKERLVSTIKQLNNEIFNYWDQEEFSLFNTELSLINKRLMTSNKRLNNSV